MSVPQWFQLGKGKCLIFAEQIHFSNILLIYQKILITVIYAYNLNFPQLNKTPLTFERLRAVKRTLAHLLSFKKLNLLNVASLYT